MNIPLGGMQAAVMCYDPAGELLAVADRDGGAAVWSEAEGKWTTLNIGYQHGTRLTPHKDAVSQIALSPDGKRLVTLGEDKCMRLWDVKTGGLIVADACGGVGLPHESECLAHSPAGTQFVCTAKEGLRAFDACGEAWKWRHACDRAKWERIKGVAYSPSGREIALATSDAYYLLSAETGAVLSKTDDVFGGLAPEIVAVSHDASTVATVSAYGWLRAWDVATGEHRTRRVADFYDPIANMFFLPNSKRLIFTTRLRVYSGGDGSGIVPVVSHDDPAIGMDLILCQKLMPDNSLWIAGIKWENIDGVQTARVVRAAALDEPAKGLNL